MNVTLTLHETPPSMNVVIPGEPRSKARPQFTRTGKTYSDKIQRAHEDTLGWYFRSALRGGLFKENVAVEITFYRSNRQRIDLDNLMKSVLDAATGIVWEDDSQVTRLAASLELDTATPRTLVTVTPTQSTMKRGEAADVAGECATCGKEFTFRQYASVPKGQRYCSRECVVRQTATCPECGTTFEKHATQQRFCSKPCAAWSRDTREKIARAHRQAADPPPTCKACGTRLQRRGAVLCRPCWLAKAAKGKRKEEML